jgi:hypothetical protein
MYAAVNWVVTNLVIASVPGGAAAALELTALHVRLLSVCTDTECQCEHLHTHSHRSGSTSGGPQPLEVGTYKCHSWSLLIGIQK